MATIHPFRPIRPNPLFADQLVFTKPQTESVAGGPTQALKTLLETGARQRPETPEGQQLAYQDIRETLQRLLETDRLYREESPCIYIYEVVHQTYRQTGIWALTALEDYRQGQVKIHELTFADSVRRIKNYREHTSLEGSPILLTYFPVIAINRIIAEVKASQPKASFGNQQGIHRIWKITEPGALQALTEAFAQTGPVYLADGHHRLEAASLSCFKTISSLYMATDQLRVEAYHRLIVPDQQPDKTAFFSALAEDFYLRESTDNRPVEPRESRHMGMCLAGEWYHLLAKAHCYTDHTRIDPVIFQERVCTKIFGILDPKTDQRLKCAGGEKALEEIGALFQAHPMAIAFTLCPLTVNELIHAADAGQILPPKSTWIVPKVPYGLLINIL